MKIIIKEKERGRGEDSHVNNYKGKLKRGESTLIIIKENIIIIEKLKKKKLLNKYLMICLISFVGYHIPYIIENVFFPACLWEKKIPDPGVVLFR